MPITRNAELKATILTLECELSRLKSHANRNTDPTVAKDFVNSQMNQLIGMVRATIEHEDEPDRKFRISQLCGRISVACDQFGGARVGVTGEGIEVEWHNRREKERDLVPSILVSLGHKSLGNNHYEFGTSSICVKEVI